VTGDVRTDPIQRPPGRDPAVKMDDEVSADIRPAELSVPSTNDID